MSKKAIEKKLIKKVMEDKDDRPAPKWVSKKVDPLSAALGCYDMAYFHRMTWEWLCQEYAGRKYRMTVDRYYPNKKIAIDMKNEHGNVDNTELKKSLCLEHGIQYFVLRDMQDVDSMIKQIEAH